MIDCLYTGPATDSISIDCWWGTASYPYIHLREIPREQRETFGPFVTPKMYSMPPRLLPHSAFDWKKRVKAPGSLQDSLPEKG